jgi:hypothetical protein
MEDFVLIAFQIEITFMSDISYYNHQTITGWPDMLLSDHHMNTHLATTSV